ncbi:hypothetical protein EGW08_004176 [Elysia chlorotica]|uniref:Uncharacterized protein n=1 Tax=Elysia chlorotica TaxID=188477 RepID=A0A433U2I2_ELYCH|nr:hypothetical protein EGW08_004176 [Elysia chlorotica]
MPSAQHEDWCMSKSDRCLHCGRPIRSRGDGQGSHQGADGLEAELFSRTSLNGPKLSREPTDLKEPIPGPGDVNRVRFAGTVQEKIISRNSQNESSPRIMSGSQTHRPPSNGVGSRSTDHTCIKLSKTQNILPNNKHKNPDAQITGTGTLERISPNIHRNAYNLAVSDAHAQTGHRKRKQKRRDMRKSVCSTTGVVFSYFPLLKRPCDGEKPSEPILNVGLRQDNGSKLKLRDAMKHILGTAKLGDYYPGGKKYFNR